MVSLNDVLLAASNIPVDDPIAEIWGRGLQGGYKIIEYIGPLPITINANGDALLDYRIYGADGGVGEPMENLYNWRTDTKYSYITSSGAIWQSGSSDNKVSDKIPVVGGKTYLLVNPITVYGTGLYAVFYNANNVALSSTLLSLNTVNYTLEAPPEAAYFRTSLKQKDDKNDVTMFIEGSTAPTSYIPYGYKLPMTAQSVNLLNSKITDVEQKVKIEPNTEYVLSRYAGLGGNRMYWSIYDESDVKIYGEDFMLYASAMRVPPKSNASYIKITVPEIAYDAVSIVKGKFINTSTVVPSSYIPYSRTDTPVYIGENQLEEDEYVSFGEQKIYRDISGTLTPTDPPVPLPEIPTINGETVIDYDGEPKPSQMYVKYKGKG